MYHYAGNNPVKYTDPDGRFSWNRASEGDYQYNSLFDPNLVNCSAVFSTDIKHYRTSETGNINGYSYKLSGTKDEISLKQGGLGLQTSTNVTLTRFNINIDEKTYDVFFMKGDSSTRLLFLTDTKTFESMFITEDASNDNGSIYKGFFNRDNIVKFLGKQDALNAAFASISFGLTSGLDPLGGNFTEALLDNLSSALGEDIPVSNEIDKHLQNLIYKIVVEYKKNEVK